MRARIIDSLIALLIEGGDINHDRVAERAGVGRRTVYRYFPDRQALMGSIAERVQALAGPRVGFPRTEADLTGAMAATYEGFDEIADIVTVMRSTPQGRAARLAQREQRQAAYRAVTADAVRDLPPEDQPLATAMLQVLHTTPWLEMRDHWGLNGSQIARACGWAMEVLLDDLRRRGGKPLAEGPA